MLTNAVLASTFNILTIVNESLLLLDEDLLMCFCLMESAPSSSLSF